MEKVIVNNVDITSLVTSFEVFDEMSKDLIIGNAVSTQIKLKIKNKDNQLNGLLDYPFIIGNKTYIVYEKPEKWSKTVSVTLYDKMILSNIAYKTELTYPVKLKDQLLEIQEMTGIAIDYSTLTEELLEKEVDWYDSTMVIRNYIGFIAQCDGKNAFIEDDHIVFKPIANKSHLTDFSSNYETNELLTFSRVCYDNGLLVLSKGEDTDKTLYISSNNSYIEQSDIDRIYDMYNGLSFYSFKKFRCRGIEDLHLTDLITYHDLTIMPLSMKRVVHGGEAKDTLELSGDITIKNADTVVVKDNLPIKIKRIQVIVDNNNQTLEILAQDLKDGLGQISDFKVELGKISTSVSNTEKKVETLENNLEVQLTANLPLNQIYETATQLFIPDYTKQNLVITASSRLLNYSVVTNLCEYVWKRKTAEGETDLIAGESANKNVLTVNKNVLSSNKSIDYICYTTFKEQTVQSQVSLSLTVNGKDGVDGKPGTPGKDAILCKINATSTVFTLLKLEDGTITSNPNSINLTGDFQNCEYAGWYYSLDGINFENVENIEGCSVQAKTKVLTIESTSSLFSERTSVVFKLTSDVATAQDTVTIITTLDNTYIDNELGNIKDTVEKVTYTADTALSEINALNGTIIDTITNTTTTLINDSVTEINKQLIEFKETINGLDISKVIEKTDVLEGTLNAYSEYLHLGTDSIRLGKSNSSIQTVITNDKFAIQQNNVDIAYVSANKLFIESALILNDITVGNEKDGYYRWRLRANGNYSLTYSKEV